MLSSNDNNNEIDRCSIVLVVFPFVTVDIRFKTAEARWMNESTTRNEHSRNFTGPRAHTNVRKKHPVRYSKRKSDVLRLSVLNGFAFNWTEKKPFLLILMLYMWKHTTLQLPPLHFIARSLFAVICLPFSVLSLFFCYFMFPLFPSVLLARSLDRCYIDAFRSRAFSNVLCISVFVNVMNFASYI